MNQPPAEQPPVEQAPAEDRLTRARRRRAERKLRELHGDERDRILDELDQQVGLKSSRLFFALLSGLLIGAGFRFDEFVLILAGVLVAPRMIPILGLAMGATLGSSRTFLRSFVSLLLLVIVFGAGLWLTINVVDGSDTLSEIVFSHAQLSYLEFVLLLVGAALLANRFSRDKALATLASAAVAYELFLPLGTMVVGLSGLQTGVLWGSLLTFILHLTWAVGAAMCVLMALGFRPKVRAAGAYLSTVVLMSVIVLSSMLSLGGAILVVTPMPTPTSTRLPTATPTVTITGTPTMKPTSTATVTPTLTATQAPTSTSTPSQGIIFGTGGVGVMLRESPNGAPLGGLFDDTRLEIIGGPLELEGKVWWQVRTRSGQEGWVLGDYLTTATPEP